MEGTGKVEVKRERRKTGKEEKGKTGRGRRGHSTWPWNWRHRGHYPA
jgi:hypothetical protein